MRSDRGFVTAELAACLPILLLLLAVALNAVTVAGARVRVQDAAREAARAVARGDAATAQRMVAAAAPGSSLRLVPNGELTTATVALDVHPLASWLPALRVTASATALTEP
jgi:Flp pilus assembly protein TadG